MAGAIAHRGPDDSGSWADPGAGIALGHRRLSILDLSALGRQPMVSNCGRFVIAYNGEVYNFRTIRTELRALGHEFKGDSDTEVIVAGMAQWGVQEAVKRFVGMFAFALWDRGERALYLVRDRLGIKPLYYGRVANAFVFGSELKALRAFPGFCNDIDRGALSLYFRHNYIPAPHSIYQGVRKLEPGSILRVQPGGEPSVIRYWSADEVWDRGLQAPFAGSMDEGAERLHDLLADAVGLRMISDVPIGAFLSGGIDSSLVVALMQAQSSRPVKTFSIGFREQEFDEAHYAKAVAAHLGTDHTELYVTAEDMLSVIPLLPKIWDEPFADSSQIPTYCVSRLAGGHVTVSLSGDGGDELFAGYDRYFWSRRVRRLLAVPLPLRKLIVAGLPRSVLASLGSLGRKAAWRLDGLGCASFAELYRFLVSHQKKPAEFVLGGFEPEAELSRNADARGDIFHRMTLWDTVSYLPDDILTKVDRASMAVGLEARVPILDHRVVEFAASLPLSMKVEKGQGKRILRKVLSRHVPDALVDRPKKGFGVPMERWLGRELRDWSESLLDQNRLVRQGYLDHQAVRRMWERFLAGDTYYCHFLWDILMFQAWLAEWEENR
ncbi:MAG: asparagine synthase (glutamine-hydrolyzing) [Pseudodesulfovibrio aespoeensis]|nr:asparagine synthase (glutamine-hydrolyzing) [Pseudodesulfovibrio aespoeensis]